MQYRQAKSVITKLSSTVRSLVMLSVALIACNGLLGMLLWHESNDKDIILVPSTLHDSAELTNKAISPSYLESLAIMLANTRLNVTPSTVDGSTKAVLKYVSSDFYASFKERLDRDEETIKKDKISSSFYINGVSSNVSALSVELSGVMKRWVGDRKISEDHKSYYLKFVRHGFNLNLTSFKEINTGRQA